MSTDRRIITALDQQKLAAVLTNALTQSVGPDAQLEAFRAELEQAEIVSPESVPPDVVTMNSTVCLYDADFDVTDTYHLVYPVDADIFDNRLSILNPMGMAVLGRRSGEVIRWQNANGEHEMKLKELQYQPEREGVLNL